jgi:hypothetical protein
MIGLAPDDTAQGDIAGVARRGRELAGLLSQGDRGRDFQGTRNRDDVERRAARGQRVLGPLQKGVGQVIIEARLDDEDAGRFVQDGSSPSMVRQPTMFSP